MFIEKMRFLLAYYLWYRMNPVNYLRSLGTKIGQECEISTSVKNFGSEPWLVEIGDRVTIASGVVFITHDGSSRLFRKEHPEMNYHFGNCFAPIKLHSNSFIGTNSILLPGLEIRPDSIVGAGSVVTRSVPPNSVAAGNPARVIHSLEETVNRCREKMIPIRAANREELRLELTEFFWGEKR